MNAIDNIMLFSSIRNFMFQLYKEEGLRGMFKGFSVNIVKGPITLSLNLTTYDYLRERLVVDRKGESHETDRYE